MMMIRCTKCPNQSILRELQKKYKRKAKKLRFDNHVLFFIFFFSFVRLCERYFYLIMDLYQDACIIARGMSISRTTTYHHHHYYHRRTPIRNQINYPYITLNSETFLFSIILVFCSSFMSLFLLVQQMIPVCL